MAKSGLRPFAAIYSTFMQRAFDQAWQEVILNGMPVVFCMDRAGFVGDDGAVHHGFCDIAFLRPMLCGETVTAAARLAEAAPEGAVVRRAYEVWCENERGDLTAAGKASALVMREAS